MIFGAVENIVDAELQVWHDTQDFVVVRGSSSCDFSVIYAFSRDGVALLLQYSCYKMIVMVLELFWSVRLISWTPCPCHDIIAGIQYCHRYHAYDGIYDMYDRKSSEQSRRGGERFSNYFLDEEEIGNLLLKM